MAYDSSDTLVRPYIYCRLLLQQLNKTTMQRDKALKTLRSVKTTTKVLAWVITVGNVHYQICEYDSRWTGPRTAIWESNKTGSKRNTQDPILTINGMNHQLAAERLLDQLGIVNEEE